MKADNNDTFEMANYLLGQMSPGKLRLMIIYLTWLHLLKKMCAFPKRLAWHWLKIVRVKV